MQGKEAILNRILQDATMGEATHLEEAQNKVDEILNDAKHFCNEKKWLFEEEKKRVTQDILMRSEIVANLDAKKLSLKAKNTVIQNAYDGALEKLRKLPKAKHQKLILSMLESASDGDTVVVSERESEFLSKEKLLEIAKKKKISLSLAKGDFSGGIVLSGQDVDKNFTFESEIELLKEEFNDGVVNILFSEEKK